MPSKPEETEPKRPVLTITLKPDTIRSLEFLAGQMGSIEKNLPEWFHVPSTRAAIASWLIERAVTDAINRTWAVIEERREIEGEDGRFGPPTQYANTEEAETRATQKERILGGISRDMDPFFLALREALKP